MNYLDLFSGIGGFALGVYWAGMKFVNHYFSEIDNYCVELYQKRFPDSIYLGDITKIKPKELQSGEWIITGGFPCQDISQAGKKEGIEGDRSSLWFEYWRIIRELRPRFVIIENVGALTIRGLDRVLSSLAEIGYNAEWQDIRASDVGASHRRERIWIVAYPNSERWVKIEIYNKKSYEDKGIPREYCNTINKTFGRISKTDTSGKNDGVPYWMDRLKGLGNAIVPQIAELLFYQIKDYVYGLSK